MSYNCNIAIQSDESTLKLLQEGLSNIKESQIEISCGELEADFREDCSGVIDDIAKTNSLTFTLDFYDEDDNHFYSKYINGTEVISEIK